MTFGAVSPNRSREKIQLGDPPVALRLTYPTLKPISPKPHSMPGFSIRSIGERQHGVGKTVDLTHFIRRGPTVLAWSQRAGYPQKGGDILAIVADKPPSHVRAPTVTRDVDTRLVHRVTRFHVLEHGTGKPHIWRVFAPEIPGPVVAVGRHQEHTTLLRRADNPVMADDQRPLPFPAVKMHEHRKGRLAIPALRLGNVVGPLVHETGILPMAEL